MKPIRKPFFGDPLFPFEFAYKTIKKQSNELPDHLHDRYELVYIHQGKGVFFIDNTWYEKKEGDLFIIPGNTIHHSLPHNENPIVSSALYFAPTLLSLESIDDSYNSLLCFDFARKKKIYRIELPEALLSVTESSLEQIQQELAEQKSGYHDAVRLISCQLLLGINRHIQSIRGRNAIGEPGVGPSWMKEMLHEIDQHPEGEVTLARLAEKANVSAPHFSRVFRQLTTMNVTQYVNAKRIIRAKELLIRTNKNITEIAELCGYETPTHFYRVFKALTGFTPNKYRQNQSSQ
ncbi:helix-turn-helix domain-containing protein [Paenibacillus sp. HN-1]|uniref:helix-turn-helix domain-containing protein n=1 Tax=Paenibacillus TaxID=44249 RepID=UPI001CA85853|nr:helix-turn-helix domain-containing protein [Paenibacillus sp. CGMCC 1.18879]MBY9086015.1 helix-turn-helix domain-containing protein [Paenibacillus sinensis]